MLVIVISKKNNVFNNQHGSLCICILNVQHQSTLFKDVYSMKKHVSMKLIYLSSKSAEQV